MSNMSIQDLFAIIGTKEVIIIGKDNEIIQLQQRIKELENKYEPKPDVKKE